MRFLYNIHFKYVNELHIWNLHVTFVQTASTKFHCSRPLRTRGCGFIFQPFHCQVKNLHCQQALLIGTGLIAWKATPWRQQLYMGDIWLTTCVTELSLRLAADSGPASGDEQRPEGYTAVIFDYRWLIVFKQRIIKMTIAFRCIAYTIFVTGQSFEGTLCISSLTARNRLYF